MELATVVDFVKKVFQVHGIDEHGKVLAMRQPRWDQMRTFFANLSPCLFGVEAYDSAHHWARKLLAAGIPCA
ncbi:hypothetical protein VCH24_62730 [Variovorax boronicumulans]|nr:hypothetical protein VCH24_62730 [Variovorax boronicumulans]